MKARRVSRRTVDDPVVAEVRAIRRRLWKRAGGTVKGYLELMDRLTREREAKAAARSARRRRSA